MDIRETLVKLRKQQKIKIKDVSENIGVSSVTLSRFENNKTELKFTSIQKYIEYLGYEIKLMLK